MRRHLTVIIILIVILIPASLMARQPAPSRQSFAAPGSAGRPNLSNQIIIKFESDTSAEQLLAADQGLGLSALSAATGAELAFYRPMSGGAYVLKVVDGLDSPADLSGISARLSRLEGIEYAEPDRVKRIVGDAPVQFDPALTPNDTFFANQWHYDYAAGTSEGLNLLPAWNITTGSSDTVVAVIDTGILNHIDLAGRVLPGYDFIFDIDSANDGDGRDSNPADPGDWVGANECGEPHLPYNSSWHGTHVAGTIGAASNNSIGVAGVDWQAKILPIRVLGKCGGSESDIIDGARWAAGLPVPGVPANPNPADVLNLSLGGEDPCSITAQTAFNEIIAVGTTVVIAGGNDAGDAAGFSPGNCNNVITVAANDRTGDLASYSNYGAVIEITAPGGETTPTATNGVLSTLDSGSNSPANDNVYAYYQGTSMATPHVAGMASLIYGLNDFLTPAQILGLLQSNAREFPDGSTCTTSICGAGIVDAYATLQAVPAKPILDHQVYLPLVIRPAEASFASFSAGDYEAVESAAIAKLTVTLSPPSDYTALVNYRTTDGSAQAGSDYVAANDTLTFSPGQTEQEITITLIDNPSPEPERSFSVELFSPSGAKIGSPFSALVTILDDDAPNPIVNGDFEAGHDGWDQSSTSGFDLIPPAEELPEPAHSGVRAAWFGGADNEIGTISQVVTIPAGAPYLAYWHWINSTDVCAGDVAGVLIDDEVVSNGAYFLCAANNTGGWQAFSVYVGDWAGQTVELKLLAGTNESAISHLLVDDMSFQSSPAPASVQTPLDSGATSAAARLRELAR